MATNWERLLEIAQESQNGGVMAPQQTQGAMAQTDIGSAGKQTVKAPAPAVVNPAAITQSFYTTPTNEDNYESGRPVYQQSQAVIDAGNALNTHRENKPGEYVSQWDGQIQQMINAALNREKFNYNFAEDPIYQMYADKYQTQGQMAVKGAMAEAAALSGGYGSTYGQQAGQQTYQNYMLGLNDVIPTLRNQAYQEYQDEGNRLRDNLSMLQTEDERQYGRYRDTVTDWQTELNYLYTQFSDMSQQEYQRYANDRAAWENDRAYWYQKAYDEQQQENWEKQFAAQYGGGGGGSGGKSKKTKPVYVDDHGIDASNTITDVLAKAQAERKKKYGK